MMDFASATPTVAKNVTAGGFHAYADMIRVSLSLLTDTGEAVVHRWIATTVSVAVIVAALTGCSSPAKTAAASVAPSTTAPMAAYPEQPFNEEVLRLSGTLSADEAAKTFIEDRLNRSDNAGKSDKFKSEFEKATHAKANGEVDYAKGVAAEHMATFTDALFVSDWQANTHLVNSAHDLELSNYATLSLWAWTYHPDPADKPDYPEDKTPYERSQTVDNVETVTATNASGSFNVTFTMHDNRAENGAAKLTDQPDPNGKKMLAAIQLQKGQDGWRVSDLTFRAL